MKDVFERPVVRRARAERCVCSRLREGRGRKLGSVISGVSGRALLSRLKRGVLFAYALQEAEQTKQVFEQLLYEAQRESLLNIVNHKHSDKRRSQDE